MSQPLNLLTDIEGVAVGHATDLSLGSGVTAIVFDEPAVASGSVLGGAPGGRDTALLDPSMTVQAVDAFVFSGGSAFGLDAAGGVQAGLREIGRGLQVRTARVPIVPQAILIDLLNGGNKDWGLYSPYRDMGYAAFKAAAKGAFDLGTVGAGTGATTATFKGGIGSASARTSAGHTVAALMAVNAMGAVTVAEGPHFWAAPFEQDGEFGGLGLPQNFDNRMRLKGRNVIARAVLPTHLPGDGDTIFSAATGAKPLSDPADFLEICHLATLVTARAIARGVYEATALPVPDAQPAWRDRFGSLVR
jgi:L-aminopeptidase/D-esterase-like protein